MCVIHPSNVKSRLFIIIVVVRLEKAHVMCICVIRINTKWRQRGMCTRAHNKRAYTLTSCRTHTVCSIQSFLLAEHKLNCTNMQ